MAMHPKPIGRSNDLYPAWDVMNAVNNCGSDLAVGDLVLLDWTADGDPISLISPFTQLLVTTRMKAIVKTQPNSNGILVGAKGQVRVQGVIQAGIVAGQAAAAKDPIVPSLAGSATDGGLITNIAVNAPGTNNTYLAFTVGAFLETKASSASAQTVNCIFDGSNCNGLYMKD